MKLLSVDDFIKFECIGGDCTISCCGGNWGIPIDDESYRYYMSVEGSFGEALRNGMTKMNGGNAFRLDEKTKDCVFLDENKLCRIYRNLGPDALCVTCRTYPRTFYEVGDITFCYLANSCPEVNRMIMQRRDPLNILFDDSDDSEDETLSDFDFVRFNETIKALTNGMQIIQNSEFALKDRLYLLLFFVERFQKLEANGKNAAGVIEIFSKSEVCRVFLESRNAGDFGITAKIRAFMIIYRSLMADSYSHPMWEKCGRLANSITGGAIKDMDAVQGAFYLIEDGGIQQELEQLMAYRFFASFMRGFDKLSYFEDLAYEIVLYSALITYIALSYVIEGQMCTQEDRIQFYSLCGRIDHTKRQKERVLDDLRREGFFEMEKLIKLVD